MASTKVPNQTYQVLPPREPLGDVTVGTKSFPVIVTRSWWRFFNATQGKIAATPTGGLVAVFPAQMGSFGAEPGNIYHIDPTNGAILATLEGSPTAGDTIEFVDTTGQAAVHNITISGNGKNITGAATAVIATPYGFIRIQFNGTQWVQV